MTAITRYQTLDVFERKINQAMDEEHEKIYILVKHELMGIMFERQLEECHKLLSHVFVADFQEFYNNSNDTIKGIIGVSCFHNQERNEEIDAYITKYDFHSIYSTELSFIPVMCRHITKNDLINFTNEINENITKPRLLLHEVITYFLVNYKIFKQKDYYIKLKHKCQPLAYELCRYVFHPLRIMRFCDAYGMDMDEYLDIFN